MTATLVLLRHGKSLWNLQNRFTGWVDVPLAEKGWTEAEQAGKLLKNFSFDAAYTSHLQRAICTLQIVLRYNETPKNPIFLPEKKTVPRQKYKPNAQEFPVFLHATDLAERHYGDLQGKIKSDVKREVGEEQYLAWRRGYDTPPPNGESLKDTLHRVLPYFQREIEPRLRRGETVVVSAHGNSLRALTKYLEHISDEDILAVEIPTGTPIVYRLGYTKKSGEIYSKEILHLEKKGE